MGNQGVSEEEHTLLGRAMMMWIGTVGFGSAGEPAPSWPRNNAGSSPGGAEGEHFAV